MMKIATLFLAMETALIIGFAPNTAQADDPADMKMKMKMKMPPVPKCPVMDEAIDFSVKTDTKDGPVYFCCKGCIKKYTAKPEKYATKVAVQRKAVALMPKIQVTCPVSGEPVDKKISIMHKGKKVLLCCQGCVKKFEKDPKKYAAKLANSYTYQTKCPVMGGTINPTVFSKLADGRTLYYCCAGCEKPFFKDPAKYAAKLEAQGMKVDAKTIKIAKAGNKPKHGDHDGHGHGGSKKKGHDDHDGHDH